MRKVLLLCVLLCPVAAAQVKPLPITAGSVRLPLSIDPRDLAAECTATIYTEEGFKKVRVPLTSSSEAIHLNIVPGTPLILMLDCEGGVYAVKTWRVTAPTSVTFDIRNDPWDAMIGDFPKLHITFH